MHITFETHIRRTSFQETIKGLIRVAYAAKRKKIKLNDIKSVWGKDKRINCNGIGKCSDKNDASVRWGI